MLLRRGQQGRKGSCTPPQAGLVQPGSMLLGSPAEQNRVLSRDRRELQRCQAGALPYLSTRMPPPPPPRASARRRAAPTARGGAVHRYCARAHAQDFSCYVRVRFLHFLACTVVCARLRARISFWIWLLLTSTMHVG